LYKRILKKVTLFTFFFFFFFFEFGIHLLFYQVKQ
jgi:hypothetical protein